MRSLRGPLRARHGLAVGAALVLLACGSRSSVLGNDPILIYVTPDASPTDPGVLPADAGVAPIDASALPDAPIDAGPRPIAPCHLVPNGESFTTISFPDQQGYSFHQEGAIFHAGADGAPQVVQYGGVYGAGSDGWGDPALYAAEYDVSAWPPRKVHPPTRISDAEEGDSFAVLLPGNRLLFGWLLQVDYGGLGPTALLFQMADATSWQLGGGGRLVNNAGWPTAPTLDPAGDGFVLGYDYYDVGDASVSNMFPPLVGLDGRLSTFTLDGTPAGASSDLWGVGATSGVAWSGARQALVRTRSTSLLAVYFPDCSAEVTSATCEPGSIVLSRMGADGALQKAASVSPQAPGDVVSNVVLSSDAGGHNWLTWWEGAGGDSGVAGPTYLFAVPLTDEGVPAGPVESWFATTGFPTVSSRGPTVGSLGAIYPISTHVTSDAGVVSREVHLVHRQLDAEAPVEDLTFTTADTSYPADAVQTAEPRSLVAAYSTYPADAAHANQGFAQVARYACAEDLR